MAKHRKDRKKCGFCGGNQDQVGILVEGSAYGHPIYCCASCAKGVLQLLEIHKCCKKTASDLWQNKC